MAASILFYQMSEIIFGNFQEDNIEKLVQSESGEVRNIVSVYCEDFSAFTSKILSLFQNVPQSAPECSRLLFSQNVG